MANNARTSGVLYVPLSGYQGMADSLQAAQTDVHAQGGGWIVVDADYAVNDTYTVPDDTHLRFEGGSLTVASGKTLTIDGRVDAPDVAIFAGTGTVVLNGEPFAPLEWFGAVGDDSTDATAALTAGDACYNASANGGALVCARQYAVLTTLTTHSKTALVLPLGGRVNVSSGKTLTWPGNVVAWEPNTTTFAGAGTVTVSGTYTEAGALSGAAGGDLTGNYPSPTIAAGKVTAAKIANGAVGTTQLAAGAATGAALGTDVATLTGAQALTNKTFDATSKIPVLLQSVAVGAGGQATVTLNAGGTIPGTYRHLELRYSARDTGAGTGSDLLTAQFNGDTGANYSNHYVLTTGTEALAGTDQIGTTSLQVGRVVAGGSLANSFAGGEITIFDYASTAKIKATNCDSVAIQALSGGNIAQQDDTGVWNSTAAITSIVLAPSVGNFAQNSTFELWGIP